MNTGTASTLRHAGAFLAVAATALTALASGACARPAPPPTPTPAPKPADLVSAGRQLYLSKGCAACHGRDALGTQVAPSLPGHTESQVIRQVRAPRGAMPAFPPDRVADEELRAIAAYVVSLGPHGVHAHEEPAALEEAVAVHHWMAIIALKGGNIPDARHHISHIIDQVTAEHRDRMQEVLRLLDAGRLHDAEHHIEEMLAGRAEPKLTPSQLHLKLALDAVELDSPADATHHVQHFVELATGEEKRRGEMVLELLKGGKHHDAEHALEELLAQPSR